MTDFLELISKESPSQTIITSSISSHESHVGLTWTNLKQWLLLHNNYKLTVRENVFILFYNMTHTRTWGSEIALCDICTIVLFFVLTSCKNFVLPNHSKVGPEMISVAKDSMNYIPGNLETDIPYSHVILSLKIDLQERTHLVTLFCCITSFKHNVVTIKQEKRQLHS